MHLQNREHMSSQSIKKNTKICICWGGGRSGKINRCCSSQTHLIPWGYMYTTYNERLDCMHFLRIAEFSDLRDSHRKQTIHQLECRHHIVLKMLQQLLFAMFSITDRFFFQLFHLGLQVFYTSHKAFRLHIDLRRREGLFFRKRASRCFVRSSEDKRWHRFDWGWKYWIGSATGSAEIEGWCCLSFRKVTEHLCCLFWLSQAKRYINFFI